MGRAALVHEYRCPHGHSTQLSWDAVELMSLVKEGSLAFYCVHCAEARPATDEERAGLRILASIAVAPPIGGTASNDG